MITLNSNNVQVCEQCGTIVLDQLVYLEIHAFCIHGLDPENDQAKYKALWSNID